MGTIVTENGVVPGPALDALVAAAKKVNKKISSYRNPVCVMELKRAVTDYEAAGG